tara:strand:+ start:263 stop:619 length:357 start_codon:yes stop_codon:yes gene_type:complete
MKHSVLGKVGALLLITGVAFAIPAYAEKHEEASHPDQVKKSATTMTDMDKQMQMGKMQEKMLRMHEQMHKIMQSKDTKEREKLMQEHAKMMQNHMSMMQGMMGGDVKGGKMDGGMKGM